jgi:hypothetical protein
MKRGWSLPVLDQHAKGLLQIRICPAARPSPARVPGTSASASNKKSSATIGQGVVTAGYDA